MPATEREAGEEGRVYNQLRAVLEKAGRRRKQRCAVVMCGAAGRARPGGEGRDYALRVPGQWTLLRIGPNPWSINPEADDGRWMTVTRPCRVILRKRPVW